MTKKSKKSVSELPKYEDWLITSLKNKKRAEVYLETALEEYQEDGNPAPLLLAFRHVALAQGGMAKLAEKTDLNRETLYRTLSNKGNPRVLTLAKLLQALGFHLAIKAN